MARWKLIMLAVIHASWGMMLCWWKPYLWVRGLNETNNVTLSSKMHMINIVIRCEFDEHVEHMTWYVYVVMLHMLTFTDRLIWHAQLFYICLCYQDQTQWSTVKWNAWSILNCQHVLLNFAASLASSSSVGSITGPTARSHHQWHGQGGLTNGCVKSIRIDIMYSCECSSWKW